MEGERRERGGGQRSWRLHSQLEAPLAAPRDGGDGPTLAESSSRSLSGSSPGLSPPPLQATLRARLRARGAGPLPERAPAPWAGTRAAAPHSPPCRCASPLPPCRRRACRGGAGRGGAGGDYPPVPARAPSVGALSGRCRATGPGCGGCAFWAGPPPPRDRRGQGPAGPGSVWNHERGSRPLRRRSATPRRRDSDGAPIELDGIRRNSDGAPTKLRRSSDPASASP